MTKILIAVPTFETIYPDVFKAIYDVSVPDGVKVDFDFIRGYDCATARNHIIMAARNYESDYVLMVDNDVIIPKTALYDFLDDPKDVCLGFYAHRDSDNIYRGRTCVCKLEDEHGEEYFNYPLSSEYTEQELRNLRLNGTYKIPIHGGGMGCAFIRMSVFEQTHYPWYDWVNYDNEDKTMLSEDLYFCEQCKWAKIPIWTDTRVGCKHILRHAQDVL